MAKQSKDKGHTKQDFRTPKDFLDRLQLFFGPIVLDLAAVNSNKVCKEFFGPGYEQYVKCLGKEYIEEFLKTGTEQDLRDQWYKETDGSLIPSISTFSLCLEKGGVAFCNPPFGDIYDFSFFNKTFSENTNKPIVMLVPIGVTDWFVENVLPYAETKLLKGRLSFIEGNTFPKDCMACFYGIGVPGKISVWDWRNEDLKLG